jgi:peptidoglycan glycosyltransferase
MNRQLKQVAVAALVMFAALLINSNVVQVGEASSLRANPHNVRVLYGEYSHQRGPIVVGGNDVARSVKTHDALKYLRTYPDGPSYAPVTGYYSLVYGATGIEQATDRILSGSDDRLFFNRISDEITGHTPQGGSVDLTIDPAAQRAAYDGLSGAPSFRGVRAGAVVALNPQTGAVLALASYPSYDPSVLTSHNSRQDVSAWKQLTHTPGGPLLNRAVNQAYPPGSTFKVITAAAALSSGKYTPNTVIPAPNQLTFPNTTHTMSNFAGETCPGGGSISLSEALKVSCNTAFGGLGDKVGAAAIAAQTKAFGFGSNLTIPLGVSTSRYVRSNDASLLADSAIGQYSDAVTPLQMAMVASGIANHGVVMKPYLVQDTKAPDTTVLTRTSPRPLGQAVSSNVAGELTTMMERVVNESGGTGTAAAIPGITVAGKTGTAENVPGQPTHAWFISFAPANDPKIAVAVLVEHGGVGGTAAAPIAKSVMCAVLSCP